MRHVHRYPFDLEYQREAHLALRPPVVRRPRRVTHRWIAGTVRASSESACAPIRLRPRTAARSCLPDRVDIRARRHAATLSSACDVSVRTVPEPWFESGSSLASFIGVFRRVAPKILRQRLDHGDDPRFGWHGMDRQARDLHRIRRDRTDRDKTRTCLLYTSDAADDLL